MNNESSPIPTSTQASKRGLLVFFLILVLIGVLRWVAAKALIPLSIVPIANIVISVVFVAAPIYALYAAATFRWKFASATILFVCGIAIWFASNRGLGHIQNPNLGLLVLAINQSGLVMWCFGLGAILSLILKDKNLLLPMAIFLALFDMWMVFAPQGLVQQTVIRGSAHTFAQLAYQVPEMHATAAPTEGVATPLLRIGPADYLFISMFFAALFRFHMKVKQTFRLMVPVLAGYLLVVLLFGNIELGPIHLGALPALLPIGLVVLIVNRDQFNLNRDEKMTTAFIAVVGTAVVTWCILQPPPPPRVETLPEDSGSQGGPQVPQGPQGSPGPRRRDPRQLLTPAVLESKQGLL